MNGKRVALITGAVGNIGRALCLKFANSGYSIAALDIKAAEVQSLYKALNIDKQNFLGLGIDVTHYDIINDIIEEIRETLGTIKVVINNAGGPFSNSFLNTNKEQWMADIDLNLNAAFYIISAVIPLMMREKTGTIINIGSVNGINIYGHPGYSAAKAGLIQLTKFIAVEFGKYGIRANIICPGTVKTDAWHERLQKNPSLFEQLQAMYSTNEIASPEDVANLALFLSSPEARRINGSTILLDGGLTAGVPSLVSEFLQEEF